MPITEGNYKCKLCGDEFFATSEYSQFTKCQCGESEIQPSWIGYSYKNGNKVDTIDQKTYYLKNEFVEMNDELKSIYDKIKKIKGDTGYKYFLHEFYEKGKNDEKYLCRIDISIQESVSLYSSETNRVSLIVNLKKEDYQGDDRTKERMLKFLKFMESVENNEMDVSKRSRLLKFSEDQDIYWSREQLEEYDYSFYF